MDAVTRAVYAKMLAGDDISEEKFAADVDLLWHLVAAKLEYRVIDETVEIDWERKVAGYRDWMRRHPESRAAEDGAVRGAPTPRLRCVTVGDRSARAVR